MEENVKSWIQKNGLSNGNEILQVAVAYKVQNLETENELSTMLMEQIEKNANRI